MRLPKAEKDAAAEASDVCLLLNSAFNAFKQKVRAASSAAVAICENGVLGVTCELTDCFLRAATVINHASCRIGLDELKV